MTRQIVCTNVPISKPTLILF